MGKGVNVLELMLRRVESWLDRGLPGSVDDPTTWWSEAVAGRNFRLIQAPAGVMELREVAYGRDGQVRAVGPRIAAGADREAVRAILKRMEWGLDAAPIDGRVFGGGAD